MIRKARIQLALFGILVMLASCGSTSKVKYSPEKINAFHKLISERNFEIEADWALPTNSMSLQNVFNALMPIGTNASRINLIGTPNYFRVKSDTVTANLPYYGERQMGGGYNTRDNGIIFETVPENLKINYNEAKAQYEIKFSANQNSESYNVNLVVYPNLTSIININSNQRFSISYEGRIKGIIE